MLSNADALTVRRGIDAGFTPQGVEDEATRKVYSSRTQPRNPTELTAAQAARSGVPLIYPVPRGFSRREEKEPKEPVPAPRGRDAPAPRGVKARGYPNRAYPNKDVPHPPEVCLAMWYSVPQQRCRAFSKRHVWERLSVKPVSTGRGVDAMGAEGCNCEQWGRQSARIHWTPHKHTGFSMPGLA